MPTFVSGGISTLPLERVKVPNLDPESWRLNLPSRY